MSAPRRKTYHGTQRRLVIAFDIGTTFSGVSYALLIPSEPPLIQGVTRFPGQQMVGGDSKIPSVVCYDSSGNVAAVGSETDVDMNPELLEIDGLVRAEWFKLHLRPSHLAAEQDFDARDIPPLPPNKTVVDVFGDLLRYLYQSTRQFIQERQGDNVWESFGANIAFVLSHPNGWEGKQQFEMRRAAIVAGLVANEIDALQRISFVTEGEASLHFCLNKIGLEDAKHNAIMVVDCGGGTVDISTYARSLNGQFKEIGPPECLFQGSFFVTWRARAFLINKLRKSRFGQPEDIDVMTKYFDKTTKPGFKGSSKPYFIRFGRSENDPDFGIRSGSFKISGTHIVDFFEPAVQGIIRTIEEQAQRSALPINTIFMVGGFATSHYLFLKLSEHFMTKNIKILRPDAYLNKAVSEGAASFSIDHAVTSRVARYTYGIKYRCDFDADKPDHIERRHTCIEELDGTLLVRNAFSPILIKDTEVSEEKEFRESFSDVYTKSGLRELTVRSIPIKCYRNRWGDVPAWTDIEPDLFPDVCLITADFSQVKKSIGSQTNLETGGKYYRLNFDVILLFGLTELKAQISWIENGQEKRGPASIVYDVTPIAKF